MQLQNNQVFMPQTKDQVDGPFPGRLDVDLLVDGHTISAVFVHVLGPSSRDPCGSQVVSFPDFKPLK